MPRIVVVRCLFLLSLLPSLAWSLGLGEIELSSALNQPFRAEIPVTSESANDLSGLNVVLASAATFRQFGLDRAQFLDGFDFEVEPAPGGAVVRIRSTQPIVEPFVTLLIEVQWAQGRLLREYTVLLDPPVFAERSAQPSVSAPVSGSAPAPAQVTRAPEPQTSTRSGTDIREPVRQAAPTREFDGGIREVRRNDTLWGIAGEMQYLDPSLNRNQLMMAIYRANPDAFAGNINRLKAGVILRVPDQAQLAQISRRDANSEVARQNEAWQGSPSVADSARLRLVPPPDADTAEQTISAAESTIGPDADADTLRQRIAELENQLADNERLIELRDQEMQELQQRLAAIQAGEAEALPSDLESELVDEVPPTDRVDEPVVDDAAVAEADTAAEADMPVVEEPPAEPAPAPAPDTGQVVTTQADDETSFIGSLLGSIWFYIALALAAVVGLFALRRRQSESPASRWESLQPDADVDLEDEVHESTTRMRAKTPEDESFLVEEAPGGPGTDEISPYAPATGEIDTGADPVAPDQETPFERTISSDVAVNLDQADPIAEAEFHMAYGLYDQAADLLTKSLESEPDRKDYRLKLLEVLFIWENQSGFLDEAKAFQSFVDPQTDPDWNKVVIMGKQICPDEALFAEAPEAAGAVGEMDLAFGEEGTQAIDLNLDEPDESLDIDFGASDEAAQAEQSDPDVLDFDMGDDGEAGDSGESPTVETPTVETDMSDSPTMETPTVESPAVSSTMETPTIESPGLGESTMETPTIESPAVSATMETPTIESPAVATTMETPTIETPVGGWDGDDAKTELAPQVDQTAEIELDDLGLDLSELDEAGDEYASDEDSMIMKVGEGLEATGAFDMGGGEIDDADAGGVLDVDSTSEMHGLDIESETAEQPAVADTAEQPRPGEESSDFLASDLLDADFDESVRAGVDDHTEDLPVPDSPADGPTMTEVGTKLDLARAYIDMGDPDGARSILNEVLEEAGESQRQEAQKLLDDLDD